MQETLRQIINEIRSAWRFRWLAMGAAWLVSLAGLVWVAVQPNVYEASARIYVDTSSALSRLLDGQIVEQDVTTQLNFVRQAILGRTQLEQVAAMTGLDRDARTADERQRVVETLQRGITIESSQISRESTDSVYAIRYEHPDRATALAVVDTLLNILVEDTLGATWEGSEQARLFLERQVRQYEERLAEAENRLAAFRREHFDRLPSTQGGYFARLQNETEGLEQVSRELELAQSRRARIEQRLRGTAGTGGPDISLAAADSREVMLSQRIQEQEARLEELLLRYTERHPDVLAARENLEQLRARRAAELAALLESGAASIDPSNPVYQQLQISLNEVEVEIATLEADLADRQQRVARLRALVDEVPEVEAQLGQLNRDYDVVHAQYQSLLRSLERERLSRVAHESERVEFRSIDPPVAGFDPVAPNRRALLLMVLMAGFGGGGGGAFLLAQLRPVFHDPQILREVSGLPVLGVVSRTWKTRRLVARRVEVTTFFGAALALVGVFGVAFVLEMQGMGLHYLLMERGF